MKQAMTRREFGKRSALGALGLWLAGGGLLELAGCSFTSVWNAIKEYVPAGLEAFSAVVSILSGQGIIGAGAAAIQAVIAAVTKAFGDVTSAVAAYQATPPAGTLASVAAALTVVANSIQQFWADLSIPDANLAATIQGLLEVITTTIAGFLAELPASAVALRATAPHALSMVPRKRSVRKFRDDFNGILKRGNFAAHKI